MNRGELVPDQIVAECLKEHFQSVNPETGILGDGVLRSFSQINHFQPIWQENRLEQPIILHLSLDEKTALARIQNRIKESGQEVRSDDNEAAIKERFKIYHTETKQVIQHFAALGRVITVDASGTVEAIFSELEQAILAHYQTLSNDGANQE
jgi:adenylate kinase